MIHWSVHNKTQVKVSCQGRHGPPPCSVMPKPHNPAARLTPCLQGSHHAPKGSSSEQVTSHAVTCKTAALTLGLVAVLQTLQLRCLPPSQGKCQQTLPLHACTGVRTGTGVRAFSNMRCHHRQSAAQCCKASLQARHDTSMQPHTSTYTVCNAHPVSHGACVCHATC